MRSYINKDFDFFNDCKHIHLDIVFERFFVFYEKKHLSVTYNHPMHLHPLFSTVKIAVLYLVSPKSYSKDIHVTTTYANKTNLIEVLLLYYWLKKDEIV
jgi:hypothetical protein